MKKILAVVCSAVLTIGMAVTAFAQPSVTASGVVTGINKVVDADGNVVTGGIAIDKIETAYSELTDAQRKDVDAIKTVEKLKEVLGSKYEDGMTVIDMKNVYVYGNANVKFPITITFDAIGITASSKVQVLHYNVSTSQWEVLESSAGEKTITATFSSLSPVAFVVDSKTAQAINNAGSGSNTSTVSPKTGEGNTMMMVGMFAVIGLVGMTIVAAGRKRA